MANKTVTIREDADPKLDRLCKRKRVSRQGLVTALILMACGDADYGIIDIDWTRLQKDYPSTKRIRKKSWEAVVECVRALLRDGCTNPEEMAMRSRFTIKQCQRALEEIQNERR